MYASGRSGVQSENLLESGQQKRGSCSQLKLNSFCVRNYRVVHHFEAGDLSDMVVVAGINGSGKTTIKDALIEHLRSGSINPNIWCTIRPTSEEERAAFKNELLDTRNANDVNTLSQHFRKERRRRKIRSRVIQFDSSRQFTSIQTPTITFSDPDIEQEDIDTWFYSQPFLNRFNETVRSIYRMIASQRDKIAAKAWELKMKNEKTMPLDFADPLEPFRNAFSKLLFPKRLSEVDLRDPKLTYTIGEDKQKLAIESLSSGEKEVVSITFDLLIQQPNHCVILFDEPELHLHSELAYRFFQTLREVGDSNQFILFTQSPELISTALKYTVFYIDMRDGVPNQAMRVQETEDTHEALALMGQNLGIIARGRKIVLIEGEHGSIDREFYTHMAEVRQKDLSFLPIRGVETIEHFSRIVSSVLGRSLWGVEFYMIRDREGIPDNVIQEFVQKSDGRLHVLKRYQLENYFLEPTLIAEAMKPLCKKGDDRTNPDYIRQAVFEMAEKLIPLTVQARIVSEIRHCIGNVDVSAKGIGDLSHDQLAEAIVTKASEEIMRVGSNINRGSLAPRVEQVYNEYKEILARKDMDKLLACFPGKPIFFSLSQRLRVSPSDLRNLIKAAAKGKEIEVFKDICDIVDAIDAY